MVTTELTLDNISRVFGENRAGGGIPGNHLIYGKKFIGVEYTFQYHFGNRKRMLSIDADYVGGAFEYIQNIADTIQTPLINKLFLKISAERDIVPETNKENNLGFHSDGSGATNCIQQIINNNEYDSKIIEQSFLKELNKVLNPDIILTRVLVQSVEESKWEIFFEDNYDNRVALSKMGSGIKTVILVLLQIHVRPIIEEFNLSQCVFAFEELENNLHPSLQRRLYAYILETCSKNDSRFYLTTHSNIVIDTYGTNSETQIIHVKTLDNYSECSTVLHEDQTYKLLDDIGIKASDLLQSNGIIWVEGPSDRIFLNRWLSLQAPELKEGHHYSIMFYGGRLLANVTFKNKLLRENLIPLLRINRNAVVVIDRDGKEASSELNETKKRIQDEIGENSTWITKGIEIENYLDSEAVLNWLKEHFDFAGTLEVEPNTKFDEILSSVPNLDYSKNKKGYALNIAPFIKAQHLRKLDLSSRIDNMLNKIRSWNYMDNRAR